MQIRMKPRELPLSSDNPDAVMFRRFLIEAFYKRVAGRPRQGFEKRILQTIREKIIGYMSEHLIAHYREYMDGPNGAYGKPISFTGTAADSFQVVESGDKSITVAAIDYLYLQETDSPPREVPADEFERLIDWVLARGRAKHSDSAIIAADRIMEKIENEGSALRPFIREQFEVFMQEHEDKLEQIVLDISKSSRRWRKK